MDICIIIWIAVFFLCFHSETRNLTEELHFHDLSPKVPPQNAITLKVKLSTYEWEVISPQSLPVTYEMEEFKWDGMIFIGFLL
jgi:hypothetical protein